MWASTAPTQANRWLEWATQRFVLCESPHLKSEMWGTRICYEFRPGPPAHGQSIMKSPSLRSILAVGVIASGLVFTAVLTAQPWEDSANTGVGASEESPAGTHGTVNIILANKEGIVAVTDSRAVDRTFVRRTKALSR